MHHSVFRQPAEDVPVIRLRACGVGFYNVFLACGPVAGLVALHTGHELVARTLPVHLGWFVLLSSVVLAVADRLALSRPRDSAWGGVLAQGLPALVLLLFV
ncbi:DUF1304 family protein [Lentzea guizhouensis]|uniref:DUF1304 family protein n=1 Tax=Lentzea guizhouensis TaxID=1586287 RepID=UPI001F1CC51C|nr:DUF1304 family protein [Lentzea guizhouensis]